MVDYSVIVRRIRNLGSKLTFGFVGLRGNMLANLYGQAVTILSQLALIPVLIYAWGQEGLGQWAILSALPALLAYGDFGFGVMAGNDVGRFEARGDLDKARVAMKTGRVFSFLTATVALAIVIFLIVYASSRASDTILGLSASMFATTASVLAVGSALTLVAGFYISVLRGLGAWAPATLWNNSFRLLESAGIAVSALISSNMVYAAACLVAARLGCQIVLVWLVARKLPGRSSKPMDWNLLRTWLRPALTFSIMPITQALLINVPLILIGRFSGTVAAAEFTAVRTYSRIPMQASNIVGTALTGPALRESATAGIRTVAGRVAKISLLTALGAGLIALCLIPFYPVIFNIWTHGEISPPLLLLLLLLATAVASAAWNVGSNYLPAINEHGVVYIGYLIIAVIVLGLASLQSTPVFIASMLLAGEIAMAIMTALKLRRIAR